MFLEEVLGNVELTSSTGLLLRIGTYVLSRVKGKHFDNVIPSILSNDIFGLIFFSNKLILSGRSLYCM